MNRCENLCASLRPDLFRPGGLYRPRPRALAQALLPRDLYELERGVEAARVLENALSPGELDKDWFLDAAGLKRIADALMVAAASRNMLAARLAWLDTTETVRAFLRGEGHRTVGAADGDGPERFVVLEKSSRYAEQNLCRWFASKGAGLEVSVEELPRALENMAIEVSALAHRRRPVSAPTEDPSSDALMGIWLFAHSANARQNLLLLSFRIWLLSRLPPDDEDYGLTNLAETALSAPRDDRARLYDWVITTSSIQRVSGRRSRIAPHPEEPFAADVGAMLEILARQPAVNEP